MSEFSVAAASGDATEIAQHQQATTSPPSPSAFAALAMSDSGDEHTVESDAGSDDSDYVPGGQLRAKSRAKKPRKRLRQSSSSRGDSNSEKRKSPKQQRKRRARESSADDDDDDNGDDDDEFKPDGGSNSDSDTLATISPTRAVSPIGGGGKFTSSKKHKRDAKSWVDDGCALTFATRIADFERAVERSVRDGTESFYNHPRVVERRQQRPRREDTETKRDEDDGQDELDDGDFHNDDVVAVLDESADDDDTLAAVADDNDADADDASAAASYAPHDVTQTESGLTVPTYIYAHLYPHQRECLEWLHHLHERNTGGILGDEMGLGKTVQIAAFLGAMHHARRVRTVLLLCPASVLLQWVREFHKWYPPLRVVLLHGSGSGVTQAGRTYSQLIHEVVRHSDDDDGDGGDTAVTRVDGGVVVSTYENVRQYQELFMDVEWDYVVLDEGHRIRNPDAETTLVCKQFRTVHRVILTGTPIQNRLRELWSLFDFVYPGKLGTLPTFDDEFVLPIRTGGYANASKMQVLMAYKCAVVLKDLITPFLLRRTKREVQHVTKMPAKMEQILFCSLTPAQRRAYATYLASPEVAAVLRRDIRPFRAISILRHICNHPDLLATVGAPGDAVRALNIATASMDDDGDGADEYGCAERSGKMIVLEQILALWKQQGHRVLLFTQTRKMLDILESLMVRRGYCFCRLDGTTSVKERQALLDAFNADGSAIFVFLLTTRAGGIGVNLTGADRVVVFDPDWNPSTDLQARERSWRLGQTKQVTIYRLITSGTIEEKIYHRQIFKQYLTSKVLHDAKRKRCFNQHSLRDLFVLGADNGDASAAETTDLFVGGNVANPARVDVGPDDSVTDATTTAAAVATADANDRYDDGDDKRDGSGGRDEQDAMDAKDAGDNDAILKQLFDGDGIRGVFNHDAVECDGVQNQEADLVEIESSKIAKSALSALRASCALVRQQRESLFTPTWTGRSGVAGDPAQRVGRFGNRVARGHQSHAAPMLSSASLVSGRGGRGGRGGRDSGYGGRGGSIAATSGRPGRGASSAASGSSRNPFAQKTLSSRDMLAKIQMRKSGVAAASSMSSLSSLSSSGPSLKDGFMTVDEMTRQLHAFLTPSATDPRRRNGVTTENILEAFAAVIAPKDKLVFRNLLRDMAECRGRKWTLKREFVTES